MYRSQSCKASALEALRQEIDRLDRYEEQHTAALQPHRSDSVCHLGRLRVACLGRGCAARGIKDVAANSRTGRRIGAHDDRAHILA